MKSPTVTERALARRIDELKLTRDVYPITDPRLAQVSELLHRICMATNLETAQWMAGDAIVQLRGYVAFSNGSH
ncbi:hypothetical protein [Burkholderia seminalis]|uniref:hypothetical protein n=1 Tax=Burkholderia seminalis TaxID=488731 RepID=UPI000F59D8E7|nr:hypothetical protein [Burkholderia seminalis]RQS84362.1 hypothetical protein DF032_04680 [Burkholderia seminalis]